VGVTDKWVQTKRAETDAHRAYLSQDLELWEVKKRKGVQRTRVYKHQEGFGSNVTTTGPREELDYRRGFHKIGKSP